jgi:hypothetical protein
MENVGMSNRSQRSPIDIDIDIGIGIDFVMVRRDIKDSSMAGAAASRSLDAGATITARVIAARMAAPTMAPLPPSSIITFERPAP